MIDEKSRRKPVFDERNSAPVVLADGQTWHFPKPWLEIRPIFKGHKAYSSYPVLTHGPELDQLVRTMSGCSDSSSLIVGAATLGAFLLCRNYELSDEDLDGLFHFRLNDESSLEWIKQVMDVATGRSGPKVSSGGGD